VILPSSTNPASHPELRPVCRLAAHAAAPAASGAAATYLPPCLGTYNTKGKAQFNVSKM